ncbi:MAG: hypothetical protein IJR49_06560 [Treponema sp.]|nr:hypothetical protein [Treponema sp.]
MSDLTDKSSNLDSYGVWVKHSPSKMSDNANASFSESAVNQELPDFDASFNEDSTLTTSELSNITDSMSNSFDNFSADSFSSLEKENNSDDAFFNLDTELPVLTDSASSQDASSTGDMEVVDFSEFDFDPDSPPPENDEQYTSQTEARSEENTTSDLSLEDASSSLSLESEGSASEEESLSFTEDTNNFDLSVSSEDISLGTAEDASDIPDSFDEETNSLISTDDTLDISDSLNDSENISDSIDISNNLAFSDSLDASVDSSLNLQDSSNSIKLSESSEEEKTEDVSYSTSNAFESPLLQQIANDLAGLKSEIADLKNEFVALKTHGIQVQENEDEGGFFSNSDEDETISLSGDELDNIMHTADFSGAEEDGSADLTNNVQEENLAEDLADENAIENISELPTSENAAQNLETNAFLSPDVESLSDFPEIEEDVEESLSINLDEDLQEPDLDSIEENLAIPEDLPEEIIIPKVDNILSDVQEEDTLQSLEDKSEVLENSEIADADDLSSLDGSESSGDLNLVSDASIEEDTNIEENSENNFSEDPFGFDDENLSSTNDLSSSNDLSATINAAQNLEMSSLPQDIQQEVKSVLLYMDQLLESLPEDKITEFARSEQFNTYKKLFQELGLS